jgi:hypothetical protein
MHIGMLWFDNDPKTALTVKIERAIDYYRQKYGRTPDLCLVHPSMLGNNHPDPVEGRIGRLTIRPYRPILPGHLWIGIEDKN